MKLKKIIGTLFLLFKSSSFLYSTPIIYIIGEPNAKTGIGQHALSFYNCLYGSLEYYEIRLSSFLKMSSYVKKKYIHNGPTIVIFTEMLWDYSFKKYKKVTELLFKKQKSDRTSFAYVVTERSKIHKDWVDRLNNEFDAVLVPEPFLVKIIEQSGVTIPIFVLPFAIKLDDCLSFNKPEKKISRETPFIFGCCASFESRKNLELLTTAFMKEFGNDPFVQLQIQGRTSFHEFIHKNESIYQKISSYIKESSISNISVIEKELSRNTYLAFLKSFDCYVLISKGEGFSITPREALALGTPCILTNNTAHKEMCSLDFVYPVSSPHMMPAICKIKQCYLGEEWNCTERDVQKALRQVYNNYSEYREKAQRGKVWVEKFLSQNLKKLYLNMFSPKNILLGEKNEITENYIMTNSYEFYTTYKKVQGYK